MLRKKDNVYFIVCVAKEDKGAVNPEVYGGLRVYKGPWMVVGRWQIQTGQIRTGHRGEDGLHYCSPNIGHLLQYIDKIEFMLYLYKLSN